MIFPVSYQIWSSSVSPGTHLRICTTQMNLRHSPGRNITSLINNSGNRHLVKSVYLQSQPKLFYHIHTDHCLYGASFSGRSRRHFRGKRAGKRVKEKVYKINTIIGRNRFGGKDSRYLHKVNSPKSFVIQVPVDPSIVSANNASTVPNIAYNTHAITQTSESLRLGLFNARSINNKALVLKDFFCGPKA